MIYTHAQEVCSSCQHDEVHVYSTFERVKSACLLDSLHVSKVFAFAYLCG